MSALQKIGWCLLAGIAVAIVFCGAALFVVGTFLVVIQYVMPPPWGVLLWAGGASFIWGAISFWNFDWDDEEKPKRRKRKAAAAA